MERRPPRLLVEHGPSRGCDDAQREVDAGIPCRNARPGRNTDGWTLGPAGVLNMATGLRPHRRSPRLHPSGGRASQGLLPATRAIQNH